MQTSISNLKYRFLFRPEAIWLASHYLETPMTTSKTAKIIIALSLFLGIALSASTAKASVVTVGPGAFGSGATLITFDGLADGTEVNGLNFGGVVFSL